MRRLLAALVVAGLVASGSGAVAQASGLDDTRPALGAVLTPDQIGITQPAQGFFPFFVGAGGQGGTNLGGIGLGGVAPTTLGGAALFGGCGVFSIAFCPFFSAAPFSQTFLLANGGALGLGSPLQGLGLNNTLGFGANFGPLSAQAVPNTVTGNVTGTVTSNPFGFGGFGPGLGFGSSLGGLNCVPQGAFLVCQ
jgi:hypothetical protein